jgi:hypothetical protein
MAFIVLPCLILGLVLMQASTASAQKTKIKKQLKDVQQRAGQRAQERATHTTDQIRPLRASATRILPIDRWTTKYHKGTPWDTTSNKSDMDRDVMLGAKILKYSDGRYVQTLHRQYPSTCGPASLAMVVKQLGLTGSSTTRLAGGRAATRVRAAKRSLMMKRDVDNQGTEMLNVGYWGSMEHLMWLGHHRQRLGLDMMGWNNGDDQFMSRDGVLNTTASSVPRSDLAIGTDMNYLSFNQIPLWMWRSPGTGCGGSLDYYNGLPGIMNYVLSGGRTGPWRDARPLYFKNASDAEMVAVRRIIKGFIDHNLSVVGGVDSRGHFNAVIGYRGQVAPASAPFWVYTADPLNGWGRRDDTRQPGTWRRILVNRDSLKNEVFSALILWNQHATGNASVGFRSGNWALQVDNQNGNKWLTGKEWRPNSTDPLNDPLARRAERMP